MFIGRQEEIAALDRLYGKDAFQMVVLYGRRRVGKTTLIEHFAQGKRTLFFTAKEQSSTLNLRDFSAAIFECFGLPELATFNSWSDAFSFIAKQAAEGDERLVFVFDEFPYAASADPSLPSTLQIAIDHELKHTNTFIVLSGSNEGFMESKVLGSKSPLYGRRTAQIKLMPFDYFDAAQMIPAVHDPRQLIRYYLTFGGTPYYLAQLDDRASYEENVESLLFDTSGLLYEEPIMLLRQELREPALYNSVLYAVAAGATKPKEVAERTGIEPSSVGKYLKTLEDLGLIVRSVPFGENPQRSKRSIYRLKDPFFAYWYRFVGPNVGAIEAGAGHAVARRRAFGDDLTTYEGKAFEGVCLQWLQRENRCERLPFLASAFGSWWGTDPVEREQVDIDVIAADAQSGEAIFGECKWRNEVNVAEALDVLSGRASLVGDFGARWLYLFTKSAVKDSVRRKVARADVRLVDAEGLFER